TPIFVVLPLIGPSSLTLPNRSGSSVVPASGTKPSMGNGPSAARATGIDARIMSVAANAPNKERRLRLLPVGPSIRITWNLLRLGSRRQHEACHPHTSRFFPVLVLRLRRLNYEHPSFFFIRSYLLCLIRPAFGGSARGAHGPKLRSIHVDGSLLRFPNAT